MANWQSRTAMLIGSENVAKLENCFIIVAGLGGVGSWVAESLARSGVGKLMIIDKDIIDESNINRQLPALFDTIGNIKVDVMAERLLRINPNLTLIAEQIVISKENVAEIIAMKPNYVVDAIDTVTAKVALISEAHCQGVPVISSMGAGNRLDPTGFQVADISKTKYCPLARAVRSLLRQNGITTGVKAVYDPVKPLKPSAWQTNAPSKGTRKEQFTPASMVFAPAVCGLTIASEVIKDLINFSKESNNE